MPGTLVANLLYRTVELTCYYYQDTGKPLALAILSVYRTRSTLCTRCTVCSLIICQHVADEDRTVYGRTLRGLINCHISPPPPSSVCTSLTDDRFSALVSCINLLVRFVQCRLNSVNWLPVGFCCTLNICILIHSFSFLASRPLRQECRHALTVYCLSGHEFSALR